MNFGANTKVSFNVGAITVSGGATASMVNNKTTNYDEIDYNDVANASWNASLVGDNPMAYYAAQTIQQFVSSEAGQVFFTSIGDAQRKLISDFLDPQFLINTGAYIFLKDPKAITGTLSGIYYFFNPDLGQMAKTMAENNNPFSLAPTTGTPLNSGSIVSGDVWYAGFTKVLFGVLSGKITTVEGALGTFAAGSSKQYMKNAMTKNLSEMSKNVYQNVLSKHGIDSETLKNILKNGKLNLGDLPAKHVFWADIKFTTVNMIGGSAIDWAASVVSSAIEAFIKKGSINLSDLALGKNALVSVYKTTFGIAFEKMFTFAGPAGQAFGKQLGTVVGASIGGFWASAFKNDDAWCAAAGVATVAGAIGGFWAGAAIAAACSASIPVAGWITGAAILIGATVATAVIYVVYWFSGGRET